MSQRWLFFKGATILTITGFATRFIGFFYRIFLSRSFGEEAVGLYQLIFPLYTLCYSVTTAGIEIALARIISRKLTQKNRREAIRFLFLSLFCTLLFSTCTACILQSFADPLANVLLKEPRCASLLRLLTYALPFTAIHGCMMGYYYGCKQINIPALSQLIEQLFRVGSVWLFYRYLLFLRIRGDIRLAVLGLAIGECASSVFSLLALSKSILPSVFRLKFLFSADNGTLCRFRNFLHPATRELFSLSLPLTGSRILLNILQSLEAIFIPAKLLCYGMTSSCALSTYGVLTGMAYPCILFPSTFTAAIAIMLLPAVAQLQVIGDYRKLLTVIRHSVFLCFCMGILCGMVFLFFGNRIGLTLFHSALAGDFLRTLAWICPFLYTNTIFISSLNGLGHTRISFAIHFAGLLLRIGAAFFLIPIFGMMGYLWGFLLSQLLIGSLCTLYLLSFRKSIGTPAPLKADSDRSLPQFQEKT